MIKIDENLLTKMGACTDEKKWFLKEFKSVTLATEKEAVEFIGKLPQDKLSNAIWFLMKILSRKQNARLAVYAVKQVLPIYEYYFPNDARLRKNIEVAESWLSGTATTDDVINVIVDADDAAADAIASASFYVANHIRTYTTYAVAAAVYAIAAVTNASTASSIRAATYAVAAAVADAVYAAADSAHAAVAFAISAASDTKLEIKILKYGAKLFFETGGK